MPKKERGHCEASWEVEDVKGGGGRQMGGGEEVSRDTIEVFTYT